MSLPVVVEYIIDSNGVPTPMRDLLNGGVAIAGDGIEIQRSGSTITFTVTGGGGESHVHSNLTILDQITEAYTTEASAKLAGIEAGATGDQSGAEIKSLYEGEADTNAFTDAEKVKLAGLFGGLSKLGALSPPTPDDDNANTSGNGVFAVGSVWIDTLADEVYRCVDASEGLAVWAPTSLDSGDLSTVAITGAFGDLVGTPNTLAGYGITDAVRVADITDGPITAATGPLDFSQVAQRDQAKSWTGPQTAPVEDITHDSVISDNCDSGSLNQRITLIGDVSSLTLTGGVNGQTRMHVLKQDATGGRSVAWTGITGTTPVINSAAGAVTEVYYRKVEGQWMFVMAIDYGVI